MAPFAVNAQYDRLQLTYFLSYFQAASRIVRRMKTHPAPLPPPPVKSLEPILPSMTDATLMNKQKLLGIVYNQLQGIATHARFGRKCCCFYWKNFTLICVDM